MIIALILLLCIKLLLKFTKWSENNVTEINEQVAWQMHLFELLLLEGTILAGKWQNINQQKACFKGDWKRILTQGVSGDQPQIHWNKKISISKISYQNLYEFLTTTLISKSIIRIKAGNFNQDNQESFSFGLIDLV